VAGYGDGRKYLRIVAWNRLDQEIGIARRLGAAWVDDDRTRTSADTETERATKNLLAANVGKLRWCVLHNNVVKLDKKLRQILLMCRIVVSETDSFKRGLEHIDYRVREFVSYVLRNSAKRRQGGPDIP
jgi:hypothetical protein